MVRRPRRPARPALALGVPLLVLALLLLAPRPLRAQLLPIGAIQGSGDVSPYRGKNVSFRGVVTGEYEDVNTRGVVYYTLFVQDLPGQEDGDPATSDGIAVFLGRERRAIPPGTQVAVTGEVTEFYGFTEIDDNNLLLAVEGKDLGLPEPVFVDPPADMEEQARYFEALEGMRVAIDGQAVVVGPSHIGCGFAVTGAEAAEANDGRFIQREPDAAVGQVVPVLYPSDVECSAMPQVKTGDRIRPISGSLVYNFDQFKILLDDPDALEVDSPPLDLLAPAPTLQGEQFSVASINAADYFDATRDSGDEGEVVPTAGELAAKQAKMAAVIADLLRCPTLLAVQEVEHQALLDELSVRLVEPCGFAYAITHRESPDSRGIDVALLSDPRRVTLGDAALRQVCSPVPTGLADATVTCVEGEEPLFGRPPLEVRLAVDGRPYAVFVNHFKSKREGEEDTALQRLAQARVQNALAAAALAEDPAMRVLVLGDFNDFEGSETLRTMTDTAMGGVLIGTLVGMPDAARFSYNFAGVSDLIDNILADPATAGDVAEAGILHSNTDFPAAWGTTTDPSLLHYRFSDHDIPWVIVGAAPAPTATPQPTATVVPTPTPVPTATLAPAPTSTGIPAPTAALAVAPAADTARDSNSNWLLLAAGALAALAVVAAVVLRSRR